MSIVSGTQQGTKSGKFRGTAVWGLVGLLAALFVLSGTMKFVKPGVAEQFSAWGFADWFRILIGGAEIAGGLALLVPRLALSAALGLSAVMVGAIGTHLVHGPASHAFAPFVLLALLFAAGYARRR